jgi:hypothetical protein
LAETQGAIKEPPAAEAETRLPAVLLVAYLPTHFSELLRVARVLKDSRRFRAVFFFAREGPISRDTLATCAREGFACLDTFGDPVCAPSADETSATSRLHKPRTPHEGHRKLRKTAFRSLWGVGQYLLKRSTAQRVMRQYCPVLIILAEENVGYATEVVVRVAQTQGARALVMPYTLATALEAAEALYHDQRCQVRTPWRRLFAKVFPHWVYEHRGVRLLRLPLKQALALELLGLAPPQPWVLHGGSADALAVESDAMLGYYQKLGLPAAKLVRTGSLADDTLAATHRDRAALRQRLCEELGLIPHHPIFLSAMPPDQLVKTRPQCDFANYDDLINFWLGALSRLAGVNNVLLLHPRTKPDAFAHAARFGCHVARWDTARLIPLCDVYVASVSATIRWAIACGKPVLNYDVYRYRYIDFVDVPAVLTVEEQSDFTRHLERLAADELFLRDLTAQQASSSRQWGNLDGQASTRLLRLCDQLIAHPHS